MRSDVVVVVLAAGAGRRFDGDHHKLSSRLPRTASEPAGSVFERSVGHALDAAVGPVVVVTGAATDLLPQHLRSAVVEVHNPRWDEGQITSLHAGIDAARRAGATSVVVGLADQPFVTPDAYRRVAAARDPIAVATYEGRRGNPVRLHADVWPLLAAAGDEGARALMRVRPDLVGEVPCEGSPADIDTTEDLRRWQSS